MKNKDILLAVVFIIIGFVYRLIPNHPPNFTPIAAMALVGGLYMNRKVLALAVPLIALFLGDIIINNTINRPFFPDHTGMVLWSDYMLYTYGAMALTVGVGMLLAKQAGGVKILLGSLGATVLFFLVTNFGSFISLPMYPKNGAGLLMSYEAGIPFLQNTLISNLVFAGIFIGAIELLRKSVFMTRTAATIK